MARRERFAVVVLDLGFGDAGKGLLTDYLVRTRAARLVVRWNGGAQAGHNVITPDGRHHTFSQFGAGSFVPGVRTLLTRDVVLHPTALAVEAAHLARVGVADAMERLSVSAAARVITPFQQAAGRLRELARGPRRHGSCGVGVGETVADSLGLDTCTLTMRDVVEGRALLPRLVALQERKRAELAEHVQALRGDPHAEREIAMLENPAVCAAWLDATLEVARRVDIVDDPGVAAMLASFDGVVLEGAQGVLLDQDWGFHPYTSWGTCTAHPARALLRAAFDAHEVTVLGVLRTYATRHGAGPLPTERSQLGNVLKDPHNLDGPWQGPMRVGPLDAVLLRYALTVSGGVDALALTHVDALPSLRDAHLCDRYRVHGQVSPALVVREGDLIASLKPATQPSLAYQEALSALLKQVMPVYERVVDGSGAVTAEVFTRRLESALERPVALLSRGPRASDVSERS